MRILSTRLYALVLVVFLVFSSSKWEVSQPLVSAGLFFMGIFFVAIAALGRLWCSLYIAGYKDSRLIQEGPYSLCRNPLYLFSLIGVVGVGMATETFVIPLILGLSFALYYPQVIRKEEAKLAKLFPVQFAEYCAAVPRFFVNTIRFKEPLSYEVNPKIFRKHIFSALWFIWLVGVLEVLEELHEMNIVATFFWLY